MTYTIRYFRELPIGTIFTTTSPRYGGNPYEWMKSSSRTARLGGNGATYYFRGFSLCHIDRGHWEEMIRATPNSENNDA